MRKVNRIRMYTVLVAVTFLQMTIAPYLAIGGVKPDLITMCIAAFGLLYGSGVGLEAGFIGGFIKDMFALDLLGVNALVGAITGFTAGAIGSQISDDSKTRYVIFIIMLAAFTMALRYLIASMFSPYHALNFGEYLSGTIVPGSAATGIISAIIFFRFPLVFVSEEENQFL